MVAGGEDSGEGSKEAVLVVIGVAEESMSWAVIELVEEVSLVVELGAEYTAAVAGEAMKEE